MTKFLLLFFSFFIVLGAHSQCEDGEIEVSITVHSDNWGYETYWELLPAGNLCGDEPLFIGGNVEVGCEGAGDQDAPAGGYENNTSTLEGPFCLEIDGEYDIVFIDDWGDGGLIFEITHEGVITSYFVGTGQGNTFTFTAGDLSPAFVPGDRPCEHLSIEVDGENLMVDNTEATVFPGEFGPPLIGCAVYGGWCDSNGGVSNTMWVTFTAPDEGQLEISTCNEGTNFDTAIAVFEVGDCDDFGTFNIIGSNDDSYGGCGQGNGFSGACYVSCLNPGEEYYIMVEGWAGATGIAELSVTSVEIEEQIDGFVRDVACANIKGETGSRIIPQVIGLGTNYDIVWTGPNEYYSEEWIIEDVPSGDYSCTITNECGFMGMASFTINQPDPVVTEFTSTNTSCFGAANGQVSADVSGGVDPYEFSWSGPNDFFGFDAQLDSLVEGNYVLEVTDDNGCVYSSSVNIGTEDYLEFNLGENETICWNEFLLFEGPNGFFIYEWQDGSDGSSLVFSAQDSGEGSHDVSLTILNEEGCTYTDVVSIQVENCIGIEEIDTEAFMFYPNPTDDQLNLSMSLSALDDETGKDVFVSIRNSIGQEVLTLPINLLNTSIAIDVSGFGSGVYLVSVVQDGVSTYSEKVIVE